MIRKFLLTFFTICMTLGGSTLLTGCADEDFPYMPGADGRTTLNLLIPSTQMAYANTRAEEIANTAHGEKTADEGKISTLAVVGFYTEGNKTEKFYAELTNETATMVDAVYRSYKIAVKPAPYDLYVLANIDVPGTLKDKLKDKNFSGTISELETTVKELAYSYTKDDAAKFPAAETGLPMAAKVKASLSEGENKNVVIPLEFICAKVRLSVIYNKAFGPTEKFKINGLQLSDIYSPTDLFPIDEDATHGTGSKSDIAGPHSLGAGAHHDLSDKEAESPLSYWLAYSDNMYSSSDPDPLDQLGNRAVATADPNGWIRFGWQETAYIPQCVGKSADETPYLILKTGKGDKTIKIGCDAEGHACKIERGNFYDIVAMVTTDGDVTVKWQAKSWTPVDMAVYLAGMSNLYLAETHICKTQETALSGANPHEIAYETTGPALSFEIPSIDLSLLDPNVSGSMPLFDVEEDRDNGVIRVTVNSDLPDDLAAKYHISESGDIDNSFWVISGNIRKQVVIDWIDLEKYLRILPKDMSLSISNISSTQTAPSYYFDYATNAANEANPLELVLTDYTNGNENQYGSGGHEDSGVYLTICDKNKQTLTKPIPMVVGSTITLTDINNMLDQTVEIPDDGYIALTILDPSDPKAFSKTISGKIEATAGGLSAAAEFTINPVPTVYTIYFRDIKDKWSNPHVYVYQPLEYNGIDVYGNKQGASENVNWLEYSFTGNRAFKGWKKDGGIIPNLSINTSDFYANGANVKAYHVGDSWGDPTGYTTNGTLPDGYYKTVELVKLTSEYCDCSTCRTSGSFELWPGAGMKSVTVAGQRWWKIELPLLAKPDKALVMFTDGHDRNSGTRYPGGNEPGMALPNYSDREAWFLYDSDASEHEFTDNRPTTGQSSNPTNPSGNVTIYCIDDEGWIKWPFEISGSAPYVQLNGSGWPGTQMTKTSDSNNVVPIFSVSIPATTYKLLFHNNSDWEDSWRRQKDFSTANQSTYFTANSYFRTSGETGKITLPACASGKKRFTAILSDDLSNEPYVYLFGSNGNQIWDSSTVKAQKMTHVSGRVWYYDVPTTYQNVIVISGGNQSNDIYSFTTDMYYVEKK